MANTCERSITVETVQTRAYGRVLLQLTGFFPDTINPQGLEHADKLYSEAMAAARAGSPDARRLAGLAAKRQAAQQELATAESEALRLAADQKRAIGGDAKAADLTGLALRERAARDKVAAIRSILQAADDETRATTRAMREAGFCGDGAAAAVKGLLADIASTEARLAKAVAPLVLQLLRQHAALNALKQRLSTGGTDSDLGAA